MQRVILSVMVVLVAGSYAARQANGQVTDEQVQAAIKKGVGFLYASQEKWGHWDVEDPTKAKGHDQIQHAGLTALVLYGLFSAGEEYQGNPKIQSALEFLGKSKTNGTYAVGLRAHVWPKLPDAYLDFLKTDAYLLMEGLNAKGGYRYELGGTDIDNSCTQYGVLGAWECAKRGVPISRDYWTRVENWVMSSQNADGGWPYRAGDDTRLTMAAAGLAMLYITFDYLHASDFIRPGVTENHPIHKRIDMGLDWFDKNFKADNQGYDMVGVERVGLASGRKYFKGQDWYRAGAAEFLKSQKGDGSIGGDKRGPVVNTAFALVFLSRGRVPVFVNKLEIPGYAWNNRPRDMANVAKWASDEFEYPMNWQIVDIDHEPEQWLDAPLLYLASHQPLALDEPKLAKIKRFIDLGGMLVVSADGGERAFTESVIKTFQDAYPHKFQRVGHEDELLNLVHRVKSDQVMSMHNGVRHLIVMLPADPGAAWQVSSERDPTPWNLMANLYQYAIEKSRPRARLEQHYEVKKAKPSNTVYVGRAKYEGNWNPEPAAWERLDVFSANAGKAQFQTREVDFDALGSADVSMVHVVGTDTVNFTEAQSAALRQYVQGGGVVVFEAAGGKPTFTESVLKFVTTTFPEQRMTRLSAVSPLINGQAVTNGFDSSTVDYREFFKQRVGGSSRVALQAMLFDDQPRIIISAEDLSNGMLGQPVWGVFGYDATSARKLMTNIGLWAKQVHPANGQTAEAAPEQAMAE